ncbi:MAG: hypothetical protein AB8G77_11800 [Rhodothermales bacterium]
MNPDKKKVTCKCGHARDHFWVSPKAQYSGWSFVMGVFMGLSAGAPKSIKFICRKCDMVIEESFDKETILKYNQS